MIVLLVDDNASLVRGLSAFLTQDGHTAYTAGCVREAVTLLGRFTFDLVITDLRLPDGDGLEVIRAARGRDHPPEVILMTAFGSVDSAVEAMKLGAMDYLTKPVPPEEFSFRIEKAARLRQMRETVDTLQRAQSTLLESTGLGEPLDELVGASPAMRQIKDLIKRAAGAPSTVLITGETGVGKEMVARAIHALSPWASGPFVRVNCASIPDSLFESELFGHEKGAFTDARERRIGRFEAAHKGTLFLDEVGEVPLAMQPKLLRALQEKEVVRLGGNQTIRVETRILAATNRNLEQMAREGAFREDLLYRLAVLRVHIPPLRERREDIIPLTEKLLARLQQEFGRTGLHLAPAAAAVLRGESWPGNTRELRNVLERALVLTDGVELQPADLTCGPRPPALPERSSLSGAQPGGARQLLPALERLEKQLIVEALERHNGVKSHAADDLGIPRTNLLYRMKKLGLS